MSANTLCEYLMFDVVEIEDDIKDEAKLALEFMFIVAAVGHEVPELMLKLYSSQLSLSDEVIKSAANFLVGMDLLHVECSCYHAIIPRIEDDEHDPDACADTVYRGDIVMSQYGTCMAASDESYWYRKGFEQLRNKTEEYEWAKSRISELREELEDITL